MPERQRRSGFRMQQPFQICRFVLCMSGQQRQQCRFGSGSRQKRYFGALADRGYSAVMGQDDCGILEIQQFYYAFKKVHFCRHAGIDSEQTSDFPGDVLAFHSCARVGTYIHKHGLCRWTCRLSKTSFRSRRAGSQTNRKSVLLKSI